MALNFDLLKSKLEDLKSDGSSRGDSTLFWKPTDEHQIRILPYIHNMENPFIELYFYYKLDSRPHLSPASFNDPDPILEFCRKLETTGNKDDFIQAKRLEPKRRVHVPILVRGKEHEGVKFWGFSDTLYQSLIENMMDPDVGDITDIKNGRDVVVKRAEPKNEGAYPTITARVKPVITPATEDPDVQKLIAKMPKAQEIFKPTPYDELEQLFENYIKPEKADEKMSQTQQSSQPTTNTSQPSGDSNIKDAVDTFNSLFGG